MKKFLGIILSAVMLSGSLSAIPVNIINAAESQFSVAAGGTNTIYAEWLNDSNALAAKAYYKESGTTEYKPVDAALVRQDNTGGRVDIPGLKAGSYDIRIVTAGGKTFARKDIKVNADDLSGYAHFNYSNVGGYNDDGTPKADAQILYVTNENKNDVSINGIKGIGKILSSAYKVDKPLIVRIIGKVDTQTRDSDGTKKTDIANGVVAINGLSDKEMNKDSYFNMCDVNTPKNLTIEGIGDDAVIEKWGFTLKNGTGVDVKNLHFTKYPEDACSTSGGQHIWIHNNTFDVGENKYDLTEEQDKHEGDGSTDIIESKYVTLSYNRYNNCHKTSLHGGGDSVKQYNITWHHNYFNKSSSRMPLVRHANVHSYNNYFYKGGKCIDARASAWVLSEANYFEGCTNAYLTSENKTEGNPVIKAYNDVLDNSGKLDRVGTVHTALTRDEVYDESSNKESYHNFDTDTSKFYYDAINKVSDVSKLTSAKQAKEDCIAQSGVLVSKAVIEGSEDTQGGDIPSESTTESTTEVTTEVTTVEYVNLFDGLKKDVDYGDIFVLEDMPFSENSQTIDGVSYPGSVTSPTTPVFTDGIPTDGCVIKLTPKTDAVFTIAFKLNKTKNFYITDDTGEVIKELEGGEASAYYCLSSKLKGGKTYYAYCRASKMQTYALSLVQEPKEEVFLYGDADNSGLLTSNDAAMILAKVLDSTFETELERVTPNAFKYLNVNGDESLTAEDAAAVMTKVLNKEYNFQG